MAIIPPAILNEMTDRDPVLVTYAVIHHTACNLQNQDITDIALEEERSQGFVWAGYHFVIHGNGEIQVGRPITKKPAANLGLNEQSVAICLEGNFHPPDPHYAGELPSAAQLASAAHIIDDWVKPKCKNLRYLIGHRDVARIVATPNDATACPGDLLYQKLAALRLTTKLKAA